MKKKPILINIFFNYTNTIFTVVSSFLLVPIYFKYFSFTSYGVYLTLLNFSGILGVLEFGLSMVVTQKLALAHKEKNINQFSEVLSSGLFLALALFIILLIIAALFSCFIPFLIIQNELQSNVLLVTFLTLATAVGLSIFNSFISSIFQSLLLVAMPGISNIVGSISAILIILYSLNMGLGILSIALGLLCKNLITLLALLFILFFKVNILNDVSIIYNYSSIKNLAKMSTSAFGSLVAKTLTDAAPILVVGLFFNPGMVGIYSITNRIYQLGTLVLGPIGSSIYSSLAKHLGNHDDSVNSKIIILYRLFCIFSSLIIGSSYMLNPFFVKVWVGSDKYGGDLLSFLLAISLFINSRIVYLNFNLTAFGLFKKVFKIELIGLISKWIILLMSISMIGLISVPISEIVVGASFTLVTFIKIYAKNINLQINNNIYLYVQGIKELFAIIVINFIFLYVINDIGYEIDDFSSLLEYSVLIFMTAMILTVMLNLDLLKLKFKN